MGARIPTDAQARSSTSVLAASLSRSLLPVNKLGTDGEPLYRSRWDIIKRQLNEQRFELRPILMSFLFSTTVIEIATNDVLILFPSGSPIWRRMNFKLFDQN